MTGTHGTSGRGSFGSGRPQEAMDAMWDAMDQIKQSFDKRVGTRMGRGDVRAAILALLHEGDMHGYQIIREIEERTGGRWKPSAGSVYPTLQLLADEGLVAAETQQDRKIYSLTEAGRDEAAAAAKDAPWDTQPLWDSSKLGPLSKSGFELAQAAAQAARTGSKEEQEKVVEVLDEARRRIYSILAQG
ncbi:PadR family transcriptional regulator [Demequina maris]|uniref:PadR family transcriptional regulator n=1 Tax=Demequina maris TaxID=1638982 RepID=UPI0007846FDA|nr:PadR family transcriptional regulator [Demequina maris]